MKDFPLSSVDDIEVFNNKYVEVQKMLISLINKLRESLITVSLNFPKV